MELRSAFWFKTYCQYKFGIRAFTPCACIRLYYRSNTLMLLILEMLVTYHLKQELLDFFLYVGSVLSEWVLHRVEVHLVILKILKLMKQFATHI